MHTNHTEAPISKSSVRARKLASHHNTDEVYSVFLHENDSRDFTKKKDNMPLWLRARKQGCPSLNTTFLSYTCALTNDVALRRLRETQPRFSGWTLQVTLCRPPFHTDSRDSRGFPTGSALAYFINTFIYNTKSSKATTKKTQNNPLIWDGCTDRITTSNTASWYLNGSAKRRNAQPPFLGS